jgi:transcriptional regulator with XRE-family HTH domain
MPAADWDDSFGALLARLRHSSGLTQEQLADRAGLSVRAISSLECGSRHPRRLTVDRLAVALDLSPAQRGELARVALHQRRRPAPVGALLDAGAASGPLIGRRTEVAELYAHLTADGPPALTYEGEAGIGKSRLLAEAVAMGTAAGVPVLVGVARRGGDRYSPLVESLAEHVRRTPTGPLTNQLRGCAGLDALLPELADRFTSRVTDQDHGRRLMFEAAGRFLDNIAGTGRVLLVLDDLQWAGADAAQLLAFLIRRGWGRLRVVSACRIGEVAPGSPMGQCAAELARLRLVRGRRLAALGPLEADALVSSAAAPAVLSTAQRGRIVRRAGGLPLFLVELARAGAAAGSTGAAAGSTDADGAARQPVPWHLRLAVVHQLAALPEPVIRTLGRLAVLGGTVRVDRLVRPDTPVELVLDQLDVARRYRIVDETRAGFRFRYPLMREVLAGGVGPNRRRLWRAAVERPLTAAATSYAAAGFSASADVRHAPLRTA